MNYEPDWKSKSLVFLLGKANTATLLDANQLMYHNDFKQKAEYFFVSKAIMATIITTNLFILGSSFWLSRKFFKTTALFSFKKILTDAFLVFGGYYCGTWTLAKLIKADVRKSKQFYLKSYDPDFMLHFDILCAKYDIDENMQTKGIFDSNELASWMEGFMDKQFQK